MRRTLTLEENIDSYRVKAEITPDGMRINLCEETKATPTTEPKDESWIANEFIAFFTKALRGRAAMLKEAEAEKADQERVSITTSTSASVQRTPTYGN